MRRMPEGMERAWRSGQFVGSQRAMARVTIVQPWLELHRHDEDMYATLLFGIRSYSGTPNYAQPVELPNVKSVEWDRTVESDAGEATLEFYNTYAHDLGDIPDIADLYAPGYYTYNRGQAPHSSRWSHEENEWANLLMPDNMIRTFEGYGFDADKPPERDPNLVQTGVWLIDDVEYSHEGTITVKARDLLRLLMDQLIFPPVNGFRAGFKTKDMPDGAYAYPVGFSSENSEPVVHSSPMNPQRLEVSFSRSSNHPYTDSVYGHVGEDGVGLEVGSYWLSIGNARRDAPYAFEWLEVRVGNQRVREVSFRTKGSGYKAYLCIRDTNGNWVGSRRVPYDPDHPASAPNGSDTAYVMSMDVGSEEVHTFSIPDGGVPNADLVRVTFGNLWDSDRGQYQYRAAVRTLSVYGGPTTQNEETAFADKNYDDYTDIVKLFCAWGGFFWPILSHHRTELHSDGEERVWNYDREDDAITIARGRVFGDFELTGTAGVVDLPPDKFDKRTLMEGIKEIQDIVAFLFLADEHGGVIWRHPNIYELGNLVYGSGQRTNEIPTIDERNTLISLTATLSSRNVRERVFVSDTTGQHAAMAAGFNPNRTGLRRIGGWTDQDFGSTEECRLMADMITLRQLFTYRTDSITIPGFPKIQVDDQVRIFERTTSEGFVHYVKGISSRNDLESGEWVYELSTHWLGERPFTRWTFSPADFSDEAQRYMNGLMGSGPTGPSRDPGDWGGW